MTKERILKKKFFMMMVGNTSETLPSICVCKSSGQCELLSWGFFVNFKMGKEMGVRKRTQVPSSLSQPPNFNVLYIGFSVAVPHINLLFWFFLVVFLYSLEVI